MNLPITGFLDVGITKPRSRGDEPEADIPPEYFTVKTPLTRG